MVADRQVAPVRQQRLGVRAEDLADVGGVLERRVEVDVVADLDRQPRFDLGERDERGGGRLALGRALAQQLRERRPRRAPGRAAEREERVQHRAGEHVRRQVAEQARPRRAAAGSARARRSAPRVVRGAAARDRAERQVLEPEARPVGTLDPAPHRGGSLRAATDVAGRGAAQRELERRRVGDLQLDVDVQLRPSRPVTWTVPSFSNRCSIVWLLVSSSAVKTRIPFCAARWHSRRNSSPPSPRPCHSSITETAASAVCGRSASRT